MTSYPLGQIIAIDPGKTTGFAHFRINDGDVHYPFRVELLREIQWDEHWAFLRNLMNDMPADFEDFPRTILVVEDFRLYAHEAQHQINSDFPSVQIIGACKFIAQAAGIELVLQMASIKQAFPDKELRRWLGQEWYHDIPTSLHVKDAMRHAMYLYFDRRIR